MNFLAIDFETANSDRSSACAIGLVLTDGSRILDQHYALIKPTTQDFQHTHIHGIAWDNVADQKDFAALWPDIAPLLAKADVLVAHDAPFVKDVLDRMLESIKAKEPERPFICTKKISKRTWSLGSHKLKDVAAHLGIPVDAKNPLSEALAAARILARALAQDARLEDGLINHVRLPSFGGLAISAPKPERKKRRLAASSAFWTIALVGCAILLTLA